MFITGWTNKGCLATMYGKCDRCDILTHISILQINGGICGVCKSKEISGK